MFDKINCPKTKIAWASPTPYYGMTVTPYYGMTVNSNIGQNQITVNSFGNMGVFSSNSINIQSQCAINNSEVTLSSASPAIGAGEYADQEITKVAGLNKPKLAETIVVRYEWWTSLRSKIRASKIVSTNPAFPGDRQVTKMIDLKSTPRKKKNKISKETKYPELTRFG